MEESTEVYFMRNAQRALELAPNAIHLQEQLERLEAALRLDDCSGTIDCSKAFLESLFKTIIQDVEGAVDSNLEFPQLFRKVRETLNFSSDSQAHDWLGQICGTAVAKIAELRNRFGAIGHGADGYSSSPLGVTQTQFIANISDSVASFLFQLHKTSPERHRNNRIHYPDNPDFNDFLDGQFPDYKLPTNDVKSQEDEKIVYKASEIIFSLDYTGYVNQLIQFREGDE